MNDEATITLGLKWKDEAGDGSKCFHCGSTAWLKMTRLILTLDGNDLPQDMFLCGPCGDAVQK